MKLTELLKGKAVNIMTDAKVVVQLEIETVTENVNTRTIQITPDTRENDWWGQSETYKEVSYLVKFTNGFTKTYPSIEKIEFVEV